MGKEYKLRLKFIDVQGVERTFCTERNPLNGNQMYWFPGLSGMYSGTVRDAKEVEKQIRKNCKILEK